MPSACEFEVRRNGRSLAPIPQPSPPPNWAGTSAEPCDGPTIRSSLPLHLFYRFNEPGTYCTATDGQEGRPDSPPVGVTDILIEPFSDAWLQSLDSKIKMNSRSIVSDVIPQCSRGLTRKERNS
jgi:hypothetical protein